VLAAPGQSEARHRPVFGPTSTRCNVFNGVHQTLTRQLNSTVNLKTGSTLKFHSAPPDQLPFFERFGN
jgi:hypothetical protein